MVYGYLDQNAEFLRQPTRNRIKFGHPLVSGLVTRYLTYATWSWKRTHYGSAAHVKLVTPRAVCAHAAVSGKVTHFLAHKRTCTNFFWP